MRYPAVPVLRKQAVFGAADGVAAVIGLVALVGQPHALFRAALGVALAELVGMTAGSWLSADEGTGFLPALANGAAAFACVLAPAVPFAFLRGWPATGHRPGRHRRHRSGDRLAARRAGRGRLVAKTTGCWPSPPSCALPPRSSSLSIS